MVLMDTFKIQIVIKYAREEKKCIAERNPRLHQPCPSGHLWINFLIIVVIIDWPDGHCIILSTQSKNTVRCY